MIKLQNIFDDTAKIEGELVSEFIGEKNNGKQLKSWKIKTGNGKVVEVTSYQGWYKPRR